MLDGGVGSLEQVGQLPSAAREGQPERDHFLAVANQQDVADGGQGRLHDAHARPRVLPEQRAVGRRDAGRTGRRSASGSARFRHRGAIDEERVLGLLKRFMSLEGAEPLGNVSHGLPVWLRCSFRKRASQLVEPRRPSRRKHLASTRRTAHFVLVETSVRGMYHESAGLSVRALPRGQSGPLPGHPPVEREGRLGAQAPRAGGPGGHGEVIGGFECLGGDEPGASAMAET